MKVLFVYKYLTLGGVEAVLRARLAGLEGLGIGAHAWFFHDYGGQPIFAGLEDRAHVGSVQDCLRFAREGGFDLLCSIDTEEILPGLAGGPERPRLVFECHSAYLENIEYLRELAGHPPAAVFTPSEGQRGLVRERLGPEIAVRVVPNPLRQEFVEEPVPFPSPPPRPVLAWIGRLDAQKNWEGFLELLGLLVRSGDPVEGWIIGKHVENDEKARFQKRAHDEHALGRLRWFGTLPSCRIHILLDAVRDSGGVLVSTSRGESFGLTVAEAMARQCAVVVPNQAPFTEFVEEGVSGSLFQPGSPESAAGCVRGLLRDAERRRACGRRGRQTILARFAPEPALAVLARELELAAAR
ncbi:MAG TPA: glycosyltransferase family 4 protein [Thermoanaerobaculia bacterium]|nr:glycosyltransferase family 4 protein [Thermoanaerobaculia bacterium]